jgi:hypothetical protein
MSVELQGILGATAGAIFVIICGTACCAVRCFRPQNSRGPSWMPDDKGQKMIVNEPFGSGEKSWIIPLPAENAKPASLPTLLPVDAA